MEEPGGTSNALGHGVDVGVFGEVHAHPGERAGDKGIVDGVQRRRGACHDLEVGFAYDDLATMPGKEAIQLPCGFKAECVEVGGNAGELRGGGFAERFVVVEAENGQVFRHVQVDRGCRREDVQRTRIPRAEDTRGTGQGTKPFGQSYTVRTLAWKGGMGIDSALKTIPFKFLDKSGLALFPR